MVNVPNGLDSFFKKVNDLVVDKFKTVPADLEKLNDAVCKEVAKKNTVYNKLNKIVNNLENKIPDVSEKSIQHI